MSEAVSATPGTRVVDGRVVPEAGTWEIDPSHQSFEFIARHLMAKVRGRFPGASGAATIAERPEDSTLEIEIDANSIDTKDDTRDAHMRSNDFFGVEDHPTISFRSTGVRPGKGESEWQVDGDLTIKGTTRPVTVDVEFLGGAIDPWGNQRIGFSGVVPEVDREEWGLTWNAPLEAGGFLLSKSVRLEIEAELIRK
ncbi:MAG TPA: YceI family protein [Actinomycetota bacterium]|nr:YceI family protein [Actinomycetota bacterium]